jgi:RNA polymerase sigma-70 factor (ECF subfamily)
MDPSTPESLVRLVARIADGDEAALAALYDATHAHVFGYARHVLADDGAAEEATLDVYLQVWRESARFDRSRGTVITWLMNLARSRAIDRLRAAGGPVRRLERPLESAGAEPSGDLQPAETSFLRERRERIEAALARLPLEQREAIRCAFLLGMTHVEIARFTDEPLGTIKTRIRTGLLRLRELLHPLEASA